MADSFVLRVARPRFEGVDIYDEYELVYNSSTQQKRKLQYGATIQGQMPQVVMHTPIDGESIPVTARDADRFVSFDVVIEAPSGTADGSKNDSVQNTITELKRGINGANSQAIQYYLQGNRSQTHLRIQLDGQDGYTDIPVKFGLVDDGSVIYEPVSRTNRNAFKVPVSLVVPPYGFGAELRLNNIAPGSPDMTVEGSTTGLAAGLNLTGPPDDYGLSQLAFLTQQAQYVSITTTGTKGVYTDTVASPIGNNLLASVWIYFTQASDNVIVELEDGSGNSIDTVTANYAGTNADRTVTDNFGNTWGQYVVTGTNDTASGFVLRIERVTHSAGADMYIDLIYMARLEDGGNLAPSPLMDIDTDSDGVPDGYYKKGNVATSIDATFYFSTAKSLKIGDLASTGTLFTAVLDAPRGSTAKLACWINEGGGGSGNPVYVQLYDGALIDGAPQNKLAEKSISSADTSQATTQTTGDDSDPNWYLMEVTGTNSSHDGFLISFNMPAAGLYYIDNVSLTITTLAGTGAWSSSKDLDNRNDPTGTNPTRIDWIALWGLPGDMPALVTWKLQAVSLAVSANAQTLVAAMYTDGDTPANNLPQCIEGESYLNTKQTNGAWTTPTDANRSAGEYARFTASGGTGNGTIETFDLLTSQQAALTYVPYRVYGLIRASSTAVTFNLAGDSNGFSVDYDANTVSVTTAATWELHDLGLINSVGQLARNDFNPGFLDALINFGLSVAAVPNAGTADIDCLFLMPASDGGFITFDTSDTQPWSTSGASLLISGKDKLVFNSKKGLAIPYQGNFFEVPCGFQSTRAYFLVKRQSNNAHTLTDAFQVIPIIRPRTSHLLGTI